MTPTQVSQSQLFSELKDTRKEVLEAVGALSERVDRISGRLDTFSEWRSEVDGAMNVLTNVITNVHKVGATEGGTKTTIQWIAEKFLIPVLLLGGGTLLGAIVAHLVATAP